MFFECVFSCLHSCLYVYLRWARAFCWNVWRHCPDSVPTWTCSWEAGAELTVVSRMRVRFCCRVTVSHNAYCFDRILIQFWKHSSGLKYRAVILWFLFLIGEGHQIAADSLLFLLPLKLTFPQINAHSLRLFLAAKQMLINNVSKNSGAAYLETGQNWQDRSLQSR